MGTAFRWVSAALVAALVYVLAGATATHGAGPARILLVGDSITRGTPPDPRNSYRRPLALRLASEGRLFDYLGSQQDGSTDFDRDHEGHSGWTTTVMLQSLPGWLSQYDPDIVLLFAGTNDMSDANAAPDAPALAASRLMVIVDAINDSGSWALVGQIPPNLALPVSVQPQVDEYNRLARLYTEQRAAAGRPVRWVPIAWTPAMMSADLSHPNDAGYQAMADAWYAALVTLPGLAPTTPTPTRTPTSTPTLTLTPTLTPTPSICSPRPSIQTPLQPIAPGVWAVSVNSQRPIASVAIDQRQNASTSAVSISGQSAQFTASRLASGPWTVAFTVTDSCGPWRSFVGGGS